MAADDGATPSRLRRLVLDVTPLRVSHDFRLLWAGQFVSELGYQFARVAIYVQVWELTGSPAAVGLTGLTGLIALFAGTLIGSSFIDAIFRSTITQVNTPDRLRGRLSAIFILVVTGGPRLGDFEAGILATLFSPTVSVVTGGLACVVGAALVALGYPELRAYRSAEVTPARAPGEA